MITLIISQLQWNEKKEELMQKLLKQGIVPTSYEITQYLNDYFTTQTPGLPMYRPIHQTYHGVSNATHHNEMYKRIEQDLKTLYRANVQNNDKLLEIQEQYTLESNRVEQRLFTLQKRLSGLQRALEVESMTGHFIETFHHFNQIELDGDVSRNIPATYCFIDLLHHQSELERLLHSSRKIDLSEGELSIKYLNRTDYDIHLNGQLNSLLKDSINEVCSFEFINNELKKQQIKLTLRLPHAVTANFISLSFYSHLEIVGDVTLYNEEGESYHLYELSNTQLMTWSFKDQNIQRIEIVLTKEEADALTETGQYEHRFYLKNLSLYQESFKKEGHLVTQPILIEKLPTAIQLLTEDQQFVDTYLRYYIAIDNGSNVLNWELIEKENLFQFDILEDRSQRVHCQSKGFEEESIDSVYSIFELPDLAVEDSVKLYGGYQKWKWDVIDINELALEDGFNLMQLDLDTILSDERVPCPTRTFIGCDNYEWHFPSGSILLGQQYIYTQEDQTVDHKFFNFEESTAGSFRVFLNGFEIKPVQSRLNMQLKKGKNHLQLIFYLPASEQENVVITHNLNFKDCSEDVYALAPLKRVDYYTLTHLNQHLDDYGYYAVKDGRLYVKHNPNTFSQLGMSSTFDTSGAPYFIRFKKVRSEFSNLLIPYGSRQALQVRLMAIFKTNHPAISPKLKSFQLVAH